MSSHNWLIRYNFANAPSISDKDDYASFVKQTCITMFGKQPDAFLFSLSIGNGLYFMSGQIGYVDPVVLSNENFIHNNITPSVFACTGAQQDVYVKTCVGTFPFQFVSTLDVDQQQAHKSNVLAHEKANPKTFEPLFNWGGIIGDTLTVAGSIFKQIGQN
jgi:hypothetical protein